MKILIVATALVLLATLAHSLGLSSLSQTTLRIRAIFGRRNTLPKWQRSPMKKCDSDREKALELALSSIEKSFGKGAIWRLDGSAPVAEVKVHPLRTVSIDRALGIGGLPAGRVVEIYGPESSGKTTIMLEVIAGVQAQGGIAAFVDAEHALDLTYARALGVDPAELLISQPDSGEQALEITDALVRSGAVDIVVIDSVAALVPRAELEGDMGDHHVGLQARLMSQALRKLTSTAGRTATTVVFINQLRHKIGVTFGSPETTTGGNALKFYASVRLDIRRIGAIKQGDEVVGNRTRIKVVKNKMAPPFRTAEFDILYGRGVNRVGDLLDVAVEEGLVNKAGAWYSMGKHRLGQGRDKATAALEADAPRLAKLQAALMPGAEVSDVEATPDQAEAAAKAG